MEQTPRRSIAFEATNTHYNPGLLFLLRQLLRQETLLQEVLVLVDRHLTHKVVLRREVARPVHVHIQVEYRRFGSVIPIGASRVPLRRGQLFLQVHPRPVFHAVHARAARGGQPGGKGQENTEKLHCKS